LVGNEREEHIFALAQAVELYDAYIATRRTGIALVPALAIAVPRGREASGGDLQKLRFSIVYWLAAYSRRRLLVSSLFGLSLRHSSITVGVCRWPNV